MKFKEITFQDLITCLNKSCKDISTAYGIPYPDRNFIQYLANTLVKSFPDNNFEQFDNAFQANSLNLLPTKHKVKFNIPTITEVFKQYLSYSKQNENKTVKEVCKTAQEINEIHQKWISNLNEIFETYMNDFKKTTINTPLYTAEYLAKFGLINPKDIVFVEPKINVRFGKQVSKRGLHNEDLIYRCFDELLNEGKLLKDVIN